MYLRLVLTMCLGLPALGQSFLNDNFTGNALNASLWNSVIAPQNTGTIAENNQGLEMTHFVPGLVIYTGLESRCKVSGDFDVQVDFTLLNWPAQNFHTVRLVATDLPSGPSGLTGIYRNSYNAEDYQFRAGPGVISDISRADFTGAMRLVRLGSTISAYYWNGSAFVSLGSATTSTADTKFTLDFAGLLQNSQVGMAIAFNNFKVNQGTAVCPAGTLPSQNSEFITNYRLLSQQPAAGNRVYATYRADLVNVSMPPVPVLPAGTNQVVATLTNLDPYSVRAVPGQDKLIFAANPNGVTTSSNTFTVIVDPATFDPNTLQWTFQNTAPPLIAKAGPNQTVAVGSAVFLDGGGSMNSSGVGFLRYSWRFKSRPPGSSTVLFYNDTSTATFVADVPGTYILTLTVTNGVTSSMDVTVVAGTPKPTLTDDFSAGALDPTRWIVEGPPLVGSAGSVSLVNQRVEMTMGAGNGGTGIVSRCSMIGDFDVQVDYSLLNWPANNQHTLQFRGVDLISGSFGSPGPFRGSFTNFENYGFVLPGQVFQSATNDLAGKLRFVRTGSILAAFYQSVGGSWILLGSGNSDAAQTRIALELGTNSLVAPAGVKIAFDNVVINAGTLVCP